jgi:hypothetical protein
VICDSESITLVEKEAKISEKIYDRMRAKDIMRRFSIEAHV